MSLKHERIYEIRCPFKVQTKKGDWIKCNRLGAKVYPGSSGEIKCRSCKRTYFFRVDDNAKSIIGVKVKPIPQPLTPIQVES